MMLAGLFLAGLLTAAILPDLFVRDDEDTEGGDENLPDTEVRFAATATEMVDADPGPVSPMAEDPANPDDVALPDDGATMDRAGLDIDPEGQDIVSVLAPGVHNAQDFLPGADTLTLQVPIDATNFAIAEDSPTSLIYQINGEDVRLEFGELDAVPVDNIFVQFPQEGDEEIEAVGLETLLPSAASDVVLPDDPTLADAFPSDLIFAGTALVPDDPELPDEAPSTSSLVEVADVLQPDKDPVWDGQTFFVDEIGDGPAIIDGFEPGSHMLQLDLIDSELGQLEVGPDADGVNGEVRLAGKVIAVVIDAASLSLADLVREGGESVIPKITAA